MTGEFDAAVAALGELPDDAGQAPDTLLVERMRQLVQARAMVDAALAAQLRAFDAHAAARYDGQSSTLAWLHNRLRLGADAAGLLKVARRLDGLPQLAKAFAAGEITLEHAALIARLADQVGVEALDGYEQILLDLARQAPPKQLRTACEHLRQLLDPRGDEDEAARARRRRFLTAARTIDNMVHLQGLLDPQAGDVVLAALAAAMPVPAEYEERTVEQRRADALTDVAAGWLAAGRAPVNGGIRPQVTVTISLRQLQAALQDADSTDWSRVRRVFDPLYTGTAGGVLGDVPVNGEGQPVPVGQARRLACDASILPAVLGGDGEILDIGRATRVVPAGLRRALNLRDGGCRFAGCDRPAAWCDAHHIRYWSLGGDTSLDNCVLLCAFHHGLIHEGWTLHGNPNGTIRFQRPDGTRLSLQSRPRSQAPARGS